MKTTVMEAQKAAALTDMAARMTVIEKKLDRILALLEPAAKKSVSTDSPTPEKTKPTAEAAAGK